MTRQANRRQTRRSRAPAPVETSAPAQPVSKLATLITLLQSPDGATIAALCQATGWQSHSVRGAMAGALRRKGHLVTSARTGNDARRYRIEPQA